VGFTVGVGGVGFGADVVGVGAEVVGFGVTDVGRGAEVVVGFGAAVVAVVDGALVSGAVVGAASEPVGGPVVAGGSGAAGGLGASTVLPDRVWAAPSSETMPHPLSPSARAAATAAPPVARRAPAPRWLRVIAVPVPTPA
jgi:hypothetical protein